MHMPSITFSLPPSSVQKLKPQHVAVAWWGDKGEARVYPAFSPSPSPSPSSPSSSLEEETRLVYAIRSSPKRLGAYFDDMGPLVLSLYGPHNTVLATASRRLNSVRPKHVYSWELPLLSPQGTRIGSLTLFLRLQRQGAPLGLAQPGGGRAGASSSSASPSAFNTPVSPAQDPTPYIDPDLVTESPHHPGVLFQRDLDLEALDDKISQLEAEAQAEAQPEADDYSDDDLTPSHAHETHAHEPHGHEPHAHEPHAHEPHAHETHAHEPHAHGTHTNAVMIPIHLIPDPTPSLPRVGVPPLAETHIPTTPAVEADAMEKAHQAKILLDDLWRRGQKLRSELDSAVARPLPSSLLSSSPSPSDPTPNPANPATTNPATPATTAVPSPAPDFPFMDAISLLNAPTDPETESNLAEEDDLLSTLFFSPPPTEEDDSASSVDTPAASIPPTLAQPLHEPQLLYTYLRFGRVSNMPTVLGEAPRSMYLSCKLFRRDDKVTSPVVWSQNAPNFDMEHVVPVAVTPLFLTYLSTASLVVEVWAKPPASGPQDDDGEEGGERDVLLGLVKLPLAQFYTSFRDPVSASAFLQEHLPVCACNETYPIAPLGSGSSLGSLEVVLALGSLPQVHALQARVRALAGASAGPVPFSLLDANVASGDIEWATPRKPSGTGRGGIGDPNSITGPDGTSIDAQVDHYVFDLTLERASSLRWLNLAGPDSSTPEFYVQYTFPGFSDKVATEPMVCASDVHLDHQARISVLKPASAPWSIYMPGSAVDAVIFTLKQPTLRGQDAVLGRAILPADDFRALVEGVPASESTRGTYTLAIVPSGNRPGFMGYLKISLSLAPRVSRALIPSDSDKIRTEVAVHVADVTGPGSIRPGSLSVALHIPDTHLGPGASLSWEPDAEVRMGRLVGADTLASLATSASVLVTDSVVGSVSIPLRAFFVSWSSSTSKAPARISGWFPLTLPSGRPGGMINMALELTLAAPVRTDPLLLAGGRLPRETIGKLTLLVDELELFEPASSSSSSSHNYYVRYGLDESLPWTESKLYSAEPGALVVPMRHRSVYHDLSPALLETLLSRPLAMEVWKEVPGDQEGGVLVGTVWMWLWRLMDRFVGSPRVSDEPAWLNAGFYFRAATANGIGGLLKVRALLAADEPASSSSRAALPRPVSQVDADDSNTDQGLWLEYDADPEPRRLFGDIQEQEGPALVSPRKKATAFSLKIQVEEALHLPRVPASHSTTTDVVPPRVRLVVSHGGAVIGSSQVATVASVSPRLAFEVTANFPSPTPAASSPIKIEVWHASSTLLGVALVDVSSLTAGLSQVHGWYHVVDSQSQLRGQILVRVVPSRVISSSEERITSPPAPAAEIELYSPAPVPMSPPAAASTATSGQPSLAIPVELQKALDNTSVSLASMSDETLHSVLHKQLADLDFLVSHSSSPSSSSVQPAAIPSFMPASPPVSVATTSVSSISPSTAMAVAATKVGQASSPIRLVSDPARVASIMSSSPTPSIVPRS